MHFINDESQGHDGGVVGHFIRRYAVECAISVIVAVTLVVTSPGLTETPVGTVLSALSDVVPLVACLLFSDWLFRRLEVPQRSSWPVHHVATVLTGGLLNEILEWLASLTRPGGAIGLAAWIPELLEGCAYAGVFWAVCLLVRSLLRRAGAADPGVSRPPAGLLGMLPANLREDIRWMKAEGNYVAVHGVHGSRRVNYVFSRAMEEMRKPGLQVHRSYWVALDQLESIETRKGRTCAVLKGGDRVPVSRSFLAAARQAVSSASG